MECSARGSLQPGQLLRRELLQPLAAAAGAEEAFAAIGAFVEAPLLLFLGPQRLEAGVAYCFGNELGCCGQFQEAGELAEL